MPRSGVPRSVLAEPHLRATFCRVWHRHVAESQPTIVLDSTGRVKLVTGSSGGPTIITTVAQIISNVIDFEMDLVTATSSPRLHHQHLPDVLYYERDGLRVAVATGLREWGHTIQARPGYQGDSQSILLRPDGILIGVADPRRGGAAVTTRVIQQTVQ